MGKQTRQELLETIEILKADNETLFKEITSLKHKVGGYVTAAKNQETRTRKALEDKESVILDLRSQLIRAKNKTEAIEKAYADCMLERDKYHLAYTRILSMPWYKRIFLTIND